MRARESHVTAPRGPWRKVISGVREGVLSELRDAEVKERERNERGIGEVTVGSEGLRKFEGTLASKVDLRVVATCASRRWFEIVAGPVDEHVEI